MNLGGSKNKTKKDFNISYSKIWVHVSLVKWCDVTRAYMVISHLIFIIYFNRIIYVFSDKKWSRTFSTHSCKSHSFLLKHFKDSIDVLYMV